MNEMNKTYIIILLFTFYSCKEFKVGNIELGNTIVQNQELDKNRELIELVNKTLKNEKGSLQKLINFPCGGSSGCYDLGFIITQIIYELNENNFLSLITSFDKKTLNRLSGLINVGLEYGHKTPNKNIQNEFRLIRKIIQEKNENIEYLRLSYDEVQKHSCIYSKSEGEYWNKNFHLAISFKDEIAFIKLKTESKRTRMPLILSKKLTTDQDFKNEYLFENDSVTILIKSNPIDSRIISTKKYFTKIILSNGKDTSNYEMIGFCREKKTQ